jgi:hypothetical protein
MRDWSRDEYEELLKRASMASAINSYHNAPNADGRERALATLRVYGFADAKAARKYLRTPRHKTMNRND